MSKSAESTPARACRNKTSHAEMSRAQEANGGVSQSSKIVTSKGFPPRIRASRSCKSGRKVLLFFSGSVYMSR